MKLFTSKYLIMPLVFTAIILFVILSLNVRPTVSAPGEKDLTTKAETEDSEKRKIIYWRAPMNPLEIYDDPGKSKMGMDLVPVYEDDVSEDSSKGERKIIYWKAPMDPTEIYENPGKSKTGMDLIPAYEDEFMGGVDIRIDPVVEQNMGTKTEIVQKGPLKHAIKTYGNITFDETRTRVVSQKYGGWIEKLYANYTGFRVKKGDPLYEIYSPTLLASQEEYLSAYKNFQRQKTEFNRDILESARLRLSYFDIADTEIQSIKENGRVKKTLLVRSPVSGVVTHKNVIEGSFVKTGTSLFTISDLSHVWVEAHIFEYEQNLVSIGQEVEMTLSYNPKKTYLGKIAYIFPYLQQKTRDVIIRIDFKNNDNELKPDMFTKIKIYIDQNKEVTSIFSQAVINSGERSIVFVSKGGGKYSPREITTGVQLDDGMVQVLSGLSPGEIIVTSGQFLLDSESRLREAVQKMIKAKKSSGAKPVKDEDDFFKDME